MLLYLKQRIDSIANELGEKRGNYVQYKLWVEAIDVKKHESRDVPLPGSIWNNTSKKPKRSKNNEVDAMACAFTTMANNVASAFSSRPSLSDHTTPTKEPTPSGMSPRSKNQPTSKVVQSN